MVKPTANRRSASEWSIVEVEWCIKGINSVIFKHVLMLHLSSARRFFTAAFLPRTPAGWAISLLIFILGKCKKKFERALNFGLPTLFWQRYFVPLKAS
jgi:hypothetical protein